MSDPLDDPLRHIELMTDRVEALMENANWCRAEAALAEDETQRGMLLKIAAANEEEASALAVEILDETTFMVIENRDHTRE